MSKHNDGGPAFPVDVFSHDTGVVEKYRGMSLRDYFAGQMMISPLMVWNNPLLSAEHAYDAADAMLAIRSRKWEG